MPKPFQWGKVIRCPYWRSAGPDLRIGPRALLVLWSAMERGEVRTETPGAGGSDLRCAPVIHLKSGEEKMSQLGRLRSAEGQRTRGQEGQTPADLEAAQVSRRKETSPEQEVTVLDLNPAQVRRAGVQRTPGGPVPPVIQEDDGLLQGLAESLSFHEKSLGSAAHEPPSCGRYKRHCEKGPILPPLISSKAE